MSLVRRILRFFAFPTFVAVASLLLLEIGLRVFDPFYTEELRARETFQAEIMQEHPTRPAGGAVLRAGARTEFLGASFEIGPHGLRSPEVQQPKPAGTYRILIVGDSVAFGWGVEEQDCFPRVLERLLEDKQMPDGIDRIEVINGSCPGWGVPSYFLFAQEHGLSYEPDCVVVTFINNDLTDVISQLGESSEPEGGGLMNLPSWLEGIYIAEAVKAVHDITIGAKGDFFLELSDSALTNPAIDLVCDPGLRLFAELVAPRRFAVLDTVGNTEGESLPHFAARLDELGIDRIEGFLPQKNYAADYAITPTDMHPNARGHRELAEKLRDWVVEHVLR